LVRRLGEPQNGLDDLERKKSGPYRDSNSDSSAVQPVATRYTDCAIPVPRNLKHMLQKTKV
jgi:hypothetical protein